MTGDTPEISKAMLRPQPGILDIKPYVPGESGPSSANRATKLSSNENPHGPSPRARTAFVNAAETLALYPPVDHTELRTAIGEVWGLDPARIICGVGSDEILHLLAQAYAGPGDKVLYTEHGFSVYPIVARAAGAEPVAVPEKARHTDIDALIAAADETTRIIYIANPNNPTGTMIAAEEFTRLAKALPETMIVLDGAYAEFVPGYDGGASVVEAHGNVVMTRTFSKIYGLGGLRIGWGYAEGPIIDALNRIRGPFNLSQAALSAAEAAVRDTDYMSWCQSENIRQRDVLESGLAALGIAFDPSKANFTLARLEDVEEADRADAMLREAGIIVRRVGGYGLPEGLRITIGDELSVKRVLAVLERLRS